MAANAPSGLSAPAAFRDYFCRNDRLYRGESAIGAGRYYWYHRLCARLCCRQNGQRRDAALSELNSSADLAYRRRFMIARGFYQRAGWVGVSPCK
ncbi:hypothetical protein KCP73_16460 [Salmonella enterica subsp. enterica]|nr:hypothetical protein KCP73_16460 [Salmonella enterica subsp. enterica]